MKANIIRGAFYGTAKQKKIITILPLEKTLKEKMIAEEFSKTKISKDINISNIEINPDDSSGKPDVFCIFNGKRIGVQLTEFKIEHDPKSLAVASKITGQLIYDILKEVKPKEKLIFQIQSSKDGLNETLIFSSKKIKRLSKFVKDLINDSKMNCTVRDIPEEIKKDIKLIRIQKVPDKYNVYLPGRENVYIRFNFMDIIITGGIINNIVEKIYNDKEKGKAEILLIWSYDLFYLTNPGCILHPLENKFCKSEFEFVFLFLFHPGVKKFHNKSVFIVKR